VVVVKVVVVVVMVVEVVVVVVVVIVVMWPHKWLGFLSVPPHAQHAPFAVNPDAGSRYESP